MSENPSVSTESNWGNRNGIAAAAKFNPHLWSPEELRAIFVARQRELATILQVLQSSSPTSAPQHLLITGQRGMGKSTLLQRVALAVEDDPVLNENWLPLRFPEEQYTVSTPAELWTNVIGALADALERRGQPTLDIDTKLNQLAQLPPAQREETGLSWIHQWCSEHHRRLLLLIDSTDLLFSNLAGSDANKRGVQTNGGASALWRIRKSLLHAPDLLWLGGSYQPLEAHGLYSDAFLDFFQLIELRPLTLPEMQNAILAMARTFGAGRGLRGDEAEAEVMRMLNSRPERLRAMRQLTGGNPRTTVMLYELFAAGGRDNVRADLERLLDVMTPLYKARLEVLADQPRKVLAHVMEHWAPITAKALAKAAALSVSSISAQLSRLEQEGLIDKTALSGTKRSGYQCSERFFNIWYLMRNAPRGARARVGWLVEFMRLWYNDDELHGMARMRWSGHRDGKFCDCSELEYSRAIALAMPKEAEDRHQLDWAVFMQARKGPAFADIFELNGDDADYSTPDNYLRRFEALQSALELAPLEPEDRSVWADEVKRALHLSLAEKEALAQQFQGMSIPELTQIRTRLSKSRERLITIDGLSSVELMERAVGNGSFFPDCPDARLALTQMVECFDSHPEAFAVALGYLAVKHNGSSVERACERAIELAPKNALAWGSYGFLLSKSGERYNEAETAFRKAIELRPEYVGAWGGLADLLADKLNHFEEAEMAYRKAIELSPGWEWPWRSLGRFLSAKLNRLEEAETAYRKAIELDPPSEWPWCDLGDLLGDKLNRLEEAEAAYRKAIELNPESAWPWRKLGDLLGDKLNRWEEAQVAYRKANDLGPESVWSWTKLGDLLGDKLSRLEEAEVAYRKAIEISPESAWSWTRLGELLGDRLNRSEEAEVAYRKAIEISPESAWSWMKLGDLLGEKLNRIEEAEEAYRKAIEFNPESAWPWVKLGNLLSEKASRYEEAEVVYRKAIDLIPETPWLWVRLGNLFGEKLNRLEEAEAAYRKAIELDLKHISPWIRLGNLLQDRMKRFDQAEEAYRKAIDLDSDEPISVANLARLMATVGKKAEAGELFRQSLKLAGEDDHNLRLQAHCWLGNSDLAMQSLDALTEKASKDDARAFYQLKEQCFECHAIGLSKSLVDLMERSRFADFLIPLTLALRAANGEKDALLDVAVEVRGLAEEVLSQINEGP